MAGTISGILDNHRKLKQDLAEADDIAESPMRHEPEPDEAPPSGEDQTA